MKREQQIQKLKNTKKYELVIIGGGATGLALALDGASRGYETLLLESYDFGKGTSSRSTKLLHGGVRYLAQGNISLVYEALHERNRLLSNAKNLSKKQAFIIPTQNYFSTLYYHLGLKIYDYLAGKCSIGKTQFLSKNEAREGLEGLKKDKVQFGVKYFDGVFDDARMALSLAKTAVDYNACVINYIEVINLLKDENAKLKGLVINDKIGKETLEISSSCIINATGVFSDTILQMDSHSSELIPSQGVHIVLDKEFFPSENALMIPKTSDKRVLFAIPWYSKVLIGTTDTQIQTISYEPQALEQEIDFLLESAAEYLQKKPTRKDIRSIFAGLRPLINSHTNKATKKLSRSHKIDLYESNLLSINGGKWTTCRAMAEETLEKAIKAGLLPFKECKTKTLFLSDYDENTKFGERLSVYGLKAKEILKLEQEGFGEKIHKNYPYTYAQILWALENEMAQNIEDILARRIRLLFIDAKACEECAVEVGKFIANHLKWDTKTLENELSSFLSLAKQYQVNEE